MVCTTIEGQLQAGQRRGERKLAGDAAASKRGAPARRAGPKHSMACAAGAADMHVGHMDEALVKPLRISGAQSACTFSSQPRAQKRAPNVAMRCRRLFFPHGFTWCGAHYRPANFNARRSICNLQRKRGSLQMQLAACKPNVLRWSRWTRKPNVLQAKRATLISLDFNLASLPLW
ncbi:hypothetical protein ON010_g6412 [Phytophthora cinnamomi]|nr:hypothetical protein ON010_g6412 [Phytophthora cinnamomi]